jgi:hypothetical protein
MFRYALDVSNLRIGIGASPGVRGMIVASGRSPLRALMYSTPSGAINTASATWFTRTVRVRQPRVLVMRLGFDVFMRPPFLV